MEYLSSHHYQPLPACAPQLVAYQRIITSASIHYPLSVWLNYDVQFRTLAVSDP